MKPKQRTHKKGGGGRNCFETNDQLVDSLQTDPKVKEVMKQIDRVFFCKDQQRCLCDMPSQLMNGQTISAPHMHARAIEYLQSKLKPKSVVLDVGSGSGYLVACFAEAVKVYSPDKRQRGQVIGLEIYQQLVTYSNRKLKRHYPHLFTYPSTCKIVKGSGWEGFPKRQYKEKYDAIHVGAACESIPFFLVRQLKVGGILVLPLQLGKDKGHTFCIITKDKDKNIHIDPREPVRYVPMIKETPKIKSTHKINYEVEKEDLPVQRYPKTSYQGIYERPRLRAW